MSDVRLEMRGIGKRFPGVIALDQVSLTLNKGEVLALIGENGAGKSTLMKILGGVYQPDDGELLIDGNRVRISSTSDANDLGIGFVHQELNVLDNLDIAANVFLGREPHKGGLLKLIDREKLHQATRPLLEQLGLDVDPYTRVSDLSIGQQQLVEIAKALSMNAQILIMDEPTSSLTLQETHTLLRVIKELKERGISTIYISHRLGEVTDCADRVVALRDGRNAGGLTKEEIEHDAMVTLMVGRELTHDQETIKTKRYPDFFQVTNLRTTAYPDKSLSFTVEGGEILGFAGLVGAGRSEMAQAIFGVDRALAGTMTLEGTEVPLNNTPAAIDAGIYLAPEDRRQTGLILEMSVRENTTLSNMPAYSSKHMVDRAAELEVTQQQIKAMNIKTPHTEALAMNLSGGNQQKIVLGKWLAMNPKVMIFDEPTRGIDVGAKQEIYKHMRNLAEQGIAIIMISSDMEEVLGYSDRIAVMHEGRITGFLTEKAAMTEEAVMQLAVGKTDAHSATI